MRVIRGWRRLAADYRRRCTLMPPVDARGEADANGTIAMPRAVREKLSALGYVE